MCHYKAEHLIDGQEWSAWTSEDLQGIEVYQTQKNLTEFTSFRCNSSTWFHWFTWAQAWIVENVEHMYDT